MTRPTIFDPEHGQPDQRSTVRLVHDPQNETSYIDAAPGYARADLRVALRAAWRLGLEALDPDDEQEEGEARTLDDGTTRIWLADASPLS